jgi:hypothetical protein
MNRFAGNEIQLIQKLKAALENGGVEFIDENGGGPGVRLRSRQKPKKT